MRLLRLILFSLLTFTNAQADDHAKLTQVKAVFIYNFTQFIDWPETAFSSNNAPFGICILGNDPFGMIMDLTVEEEQPPEGRKFSVIRLSDLQHIKDCQILYISESEENRLEKILQKIGDLPILTVSDIKNFSQNKGMIQFVLKEDGRIGMIINHKKTLKSKLFVNSNLLKFMTIVE